MASRPIFDTSSVIEYSDKQRIDAEALLRALERAIEH